DVCSSDLANYYVQKLFSNNAGTDLLDIREDGKPLIGQHALYASAVKEASTNELIIKLVNTAVQGQETTLVPKGGTFEGTGSITVLKSEDLQEVNSFDRPEGIAPKVEEIRSEGGSLKFFLAPQSMNVIRLKLAGNQP